MDEGPDMDELSGGRAVMREDATVCFAMNDMVVVALHRLCGRNEEIPKEVFSSVQSPWNFKMLVLESSPKVTCHFWRQFYD